MTRREMWLASLGVVTATGAELRAARAQYPALHGSGKQAPGKPAIPVRVKMVRQNGQPAPDLLTQRYEDLTAAELVSMIVGIPLAPKEPDQAERIMQLSLDLEHFISVVPIDPAQVEPDDKAEIRKLRDQLLALSGRKLLLHLFGER